MSNPIITNVGVVSRFDRMALASQVVVNGSTISADGVLARGTVLVKEGGGKYHAFVHGTDTLAADGVRILQDDLKVVAATDAFGAAYFEGFFKLSSLIDVNSGLVAGDLTTAAGFHLIESDEIRLK